MMRYAVLYTWEDGQVAARVPDLSGVFVVADTHAEAEQHVRVAIGDYLRELADDGVAAPTPTTMAHMVDVA